MELLTKYGAKSTGISFSENATDAPYTMIVKVDWIYPGWDAFVMKQAAKVSTTITIVDSNNFEDKNLLSIIKKLQELNSVIIIVMNRELEKGLQKLLKLFLKC